MDAATKQHLLDSSLTRAADLLGDITPHVFERFYPAHPVAFDRFEELSLHRRHELEGQMIEQSLYCLMQWFESPDSVRIIIVGTLPHHVETLDVPLTAFAGLMDTICTVIDSTIPADQPDERAIWVELREAMHGLFEEGQQFLNPSKPAAMA